jgi:Domain of unknown function (DUF4132)
MKIFDSLRKVFSPSDDSAYSNVMKGTLAELSSDPKLNIWSLKPKDLNTFQKLNESSPATKADFIVHAAKETYTYFLDSRGYASNDPSYLRAMIGNYFIQHLMAARQEWSGNELAGIGKAFIENPLHSFTGWPLAHFVTQIEKSCETVLPDDIKDVLEKVAYMLRTNRYGMQKEHVKLSARIETLIHKSTHGEDAIKPTYFVGNDSFASHANELIKSFPQEEKPYWYQLIAMAQKASGSKPSAKFLEQSRKLYMEIGADKFKKVVVGWLDFVANLKDTVAEEIYQTATGPHTIRHVTFLAAPNIDALKGLVWMCSNFHDSHTLAVIAALAERSNKKIPGKGPGAPSLGNASLYTLYKSKGLEGIGHLSRLKLRIKQNSTQNLIDKYLQEAAIAQGITTTEIEDLAVDDYGLINGKREFELEGYTLVVKLIGIGDVELVVLKPDGKPQKSIPAIVKEKAAAKLKKIKDLVKQIQLASSAQRDRIDRMLRNDRWITWNYFIEHYTSHGLMSQIVNNIVWQFKTGSIISLVIWKDDAWKTVDDKPVTPTNETMVALWHPVTSSTAETQQWRQFMLTHEIRQPIKQAYREVYILTDAEINTRTYSNRMAAHMLRQHQFNSLAKARGWKYSLLGAYDDGRNNEAASLKLPEYNLRAEFWVNEVSADGEYNDTGIWNYVATDQVRFVNPETTEPVELIHVPKVPFSEIMRDVDLFVGVASVGNDPNWRDNGGMLAYQDYWQSYAFGELSEIAKNRKETLERLVPRLKIAKVAHVLDKFVIVKGKLRTYKIHIGSTNILMEPNDQYLCIVQDRSQKAVATNVFLPFEGDTGLSVIISKAFLLADDDKITDTTITSQINRR